MAFSSSSGEELAIIPCPFRLVTDLECPGCGMARSCLSLAQGDFESAWHLNPFSFFLVALAVAVGLFSETTRSRWERMSSLSRAHPAAISRSCTRLAHLELAARAVSRERKTGACSRKGDRSRRRPVL